MFLLLTQLLLSVAGRLFSRELGGYVMIPARFPSMASAVLSASSHPLCSVAVCHSPCQQLASGYPAISLV